MGRNIIETVLGAVVLVVAAFFLTFALKTADVRKIQGYHISANFPRADGLKNGSDVMVNGVKVGTVLAQELITAPGKDQFLVKVTMLIDSRVQLPTDTVALIANESLMGGRYLSLEIGVEEDNIRTDGTGRIYHTQPPMRLDDLIGKLMFSSKSDDKKDSATKAPPPQKASDDDYSYDAPKPESAPIKPEPLRAQPPLNESIKNGDVLKEAVKPEEPKIVEPQKFKPLQEEVPKAEPLQKVEPLQNTEPLRKAEPLQNVEPLKENVVPTLADQIKKEDAARRRYDSRTWYDLQKGQAPNPSGEQKYAPSPDPAPLALPGRP